MFPGDEIIILGFSRGAFVARSVAGMVCSLGLLNRFGLANFGAIFSDYQNFSEWDKSTEFDPKKHLRGFDIHNSNQVTHEMQSTMNKSNMMILETRDNEKMEKDLHKQKKAIFYELTGRSHPERVIGYDLKPVGETLNADEKAAENKKVGNLQRMANIYRKHLNERVSNSHRLDSTRQILTVFPSSGCSFAIRRTGMTLTDVGSLSSLK
ncbi:hypothetical protein N0V92_005728 [Colletotrichum tropicale]|nr:hypothetical protein N0V92_005728 [Colletotrichum tropicale]